MGKRILKAVGVIAGLLVLGVAAFATYVHLAWPIKGPLEKVELTVEATPERLARGRALVGVRCAGCHYDQKTGGLTGHHLVDAPPEFGTFYSRNITQHPTKGLGRYSDGELAYLLRSGVTRDGRFTGPFMQSPFLADEDLYSIIAFLRSDDPWTRAQDVDDKDSKPTFLAKMLFRLVFAPWPMPEQKIEAPPITDQIAYGRYVVHAIGDCFVCHSADMKTLDPKEPPKSVGYLGGGTAMLDAAGNTVVTANLTMDHETGIGSWSEDQFVSALRTGFRPDGRLLRFPMTLFGDLADAELRATYAYLKTVPVIKNPVQRNFEPPAAMVVTSSEGEKLYNKYACFACHGKDGNGTCDLREAHKTYDTDEKLVAFMRDPKAFVPGTTMPAWNGIIAESDYPALIEHVRSLAKKP